MLAVSEVSSAYTQILAHLQVESPLQRQYSPLSIYWLLERDADEQTLIPHLQNRFIHLRRRPSQAHQVIFNLRYVALQLVTRTEHLLCANLPDARNTDAAPRRLSTFLCCTCRRSSHLLESVLTLEQISPSESPSTNQLTTDLKHAELQSLFAYLEFHLQTLLPLVGQNNSAEQLLVQTLSQIRLKQRYGIQNRCSLTHEC